MQSIRSTAQELREMTTEDLKTVVGIYYGDGWRPAYAARKITRGSDKGKFELVTRGKGNKAKRVTVSGSNFKCNHDDKRQVGKNYICNICGRLIDEKI